MNYELKKSCPKGQDLNLAIPPLVRRADTLLSLTQTYVTAYTGKEIAQDTRLAHTNVSAHTNVPHLKTCLCALSDQPLVSELRNAFGRSAHTFPLLSDDLIADLLSQSTGYNSIIAREKEKIKSFLKIFRFLCFGSLHKVGTAYMCSYTKFAAQRSKSAIF